MNPKDRELAHVPRWCIVRTIRQQSVAEHAFYVTRYAINIANACAMTIRPLFLEHCLKHDDDELHSGDIPAPYKKIWNIGTKKPYELTDKEWLVLKAADLLESILFLIDEELLGNKTVGLIINELSDELQKLTQTTNTHYGQYLSSWLWMRIDAHRTYKGRTA